MSPILPHSSLARVNCCFRLSASVPSIWPAWGYSPTGTLFAHEALGRTNGKGVWNQIATTSTSA